MKQSLSFLAVAVVAAVACSDAFKPTTENVLGDYAVRSFQTTDTSGTINWIQRGATFTLTLGPSGVTTGHMFVPGAGEGGADVDQLLIGDWTLTGSTITFDMPAVDTFVRDMPWTVGENRLAGDHTFAGTRIRVVLTK
jgi:hypothetical protein